MTDRITRSSHDVPSRQVGRLLNPPLFGARPPRARVITLLFSLSLAGLASLFSIFPEMSKAKSDLLVFSTLVPFRGRERPAGHDPRSRIHRNRGRAGSERGSKTQRERWRLPRDRAAKVSLLSRRPRPQGPLLLPHASRLRALRPRSDEPPPAVGCVCCFVFSFFRREGQGRVEGHACRDPRQG